MIMMTKKFFKSFKERFGEVDTVWYNCNGTQCYLDFNNRYVNVLNADWYDNYVVINYEDSFGIAFDKNGAHHVKEYHTIKLNRTDIITVDFRQYLTAKNG